MPRSVSGQHVTLVLVLLKIVTGTSWTCHTFIVTTTRILQRTIVGISFLDMVPHTTCCDVGEEAIRVSSGLFGHMLTGD